MRWPSLGCALCLPMYWRKGPLRWRYRQAGMGPYGAWPFCAQHDVKQIKSAPWRKRRRFAATSEIGRGRPASHGCIRMPEPLASRLFTQVKIGTPVTITGSGPDYGDYRSRLAAKGPTKQEPAEGGLVEPAGRGQPQLGTALVTEGKPAAPVRIQPATQVMRQPAAQPQAVQSRVTRAESVPTIKEEPATQPLAEPPQLQADQAAPTPNPPIVESDPAEAATASQTAEAPSVEPKAAQDQDLSAPVEQPIPATPQESAPPRPESPPLEQVQPAQADQDKAAPPAESAPDGAAQAEPTLKAPSQTGQDDTPAG